MSELREALEAARDQMAADFEARFGDTIGYAGVGTAYGKVQAALDHLVDANKMAAPASDARELASRVLDASAEIAERAINRRIEEGISFEQTRVTSIDEMMAPLASRHGGACQHSWATDGINPTQCILCGKMVAPSETAPEGVPVKIPEYEDAGPEWHRTDDELSGHEGGELKRLEEELLSNGVHRLFLENFERHVLLTRAPRPEASATYWDDVREAIRGGLDSLGIGRDCDIAILRQIQALPYTARPHPEASGEVEALAVCKALDEFQRTFEINSMQPGYMPGNQYCSDLLMEIVGKARAALARTLKDGE